MTRGRRVTSDEIDEGVDTRSDADLVSTAKTIVLNSLNYAPRTRKQLADQLAKKAVSDDVAEQVLDRFVEVGLIDDADFAMRWVDERHRYQGLGRAVLKRELRQKGVGDELIDEALEQVTSDDERARAAELAERRQQRVRNYEPAVQRRRPMSFLMRKGCSPPVAPDAVDGVLSEQTAVDSGF